MVGKEVLVVVEVIFLEDVPDIVGMIYQVCGRKHEAHSHDVTVAPGIHQKSQGVAVHR
jgi:hypothetical protein